MLGVLVSGMGIAFAVSQGPDAKVERDSAAATITYDVQGAGSVVVYLPSDLRAGDTISGTVVAIPSGRNDAERQKNSSVLEGCVLALPDVKVRARNARITFVVPQILADANWSLDLTDSKGGLAGRAAVPIGPGIRNPWNSLQFPRVGAAGSPIEINGPFDGNASNTTAQFDDKPIPVLAESPRGCVTLPPFSFVGRGELKCSEGPLSGSSPYNNLRLRMSADKLSLLEGESTSVKVQVDGLTGLTSEDYPIPCEITNLSPSVIRLEGSHADARAFAIRHADVIGNGWSTSFAIRGVVPGKYLLKGVLFSVGIHGIKKSLDKEGFAALMNAIIAQHEAQIAKINAEEKAAADAGKKWPDSPEERGRQIKRDLLRATVEKLKLAVDVADTDLGAGKALADKAVADITIVQLGAELLGFAAEMLGYTDIPLPGIGAILKGAKLLTSSAKVLKLIEAAEKALEAYEKASDAADKAKKLLELKEKVDAAKAAMAGGG